MTSTTATIEYPVTLDQALEVVESLPDEQQERLLEIMRLRRHEQRREALYGRVAEAEADYTSGNIVRGDAATVMKAILE